MPVWEDFSHIWTILTRNLGSSAKTLGRQDMECLEDARKEGKVQSLL